MNLKDSTLSYLQNRKDRIDSGKINCIPSPFERFSEDFVGLEVLKLNLPVIYYMML